jgi:hypothetical protein
MCAGLTGAGIHTYISHFVSPKYNGHETGHDISQQNTQLNRTQLRLIVHCKLQKFCNCSEVGIATGHGLDD